MSSSAISFAPSDSENVGCAVNTMPASSVPSNALEHREVDEPASVMSEVAEQATQPRLVVLLLLEAQLAQQAVDAGL